MLTGNLSAHTWAVSVSFGMVAGLFPIIGPVSLLSLLIIWLFRLHLPLVMLLVYGLYPLQIALMVPFGILGQAILPPAEVSNASVSDGFSWLFKLGDWAFAALLGWLLVVLPLALLCYRLAFRYARKKEKQTIAAAQTV